MYLYLSIYLSIYLFFTALTCNSTDIRIITTYCTLKQKKTQESDGDDENYDEVEDNEEQKQ